MTRESTPKRIGVVAEIVHKNNNHRCFAITRAFVIAGSYSNGPIHACVTLRGIPRKNTRGIYVCYRGNSNTAPRCTGRCRKRRLKAAKNNNNNNNYNNLTRVEFRFGFVNSTTICRLLAAQRRAVNDMRTTVEIELRLFVTHFRFKHPRAYKLIMHLNKAPLGDGAGGASGWGKVRLRTRRIERKIFKTRN